MSQVPLATFVKQCRAQPSPKSLWAEALVFFRSRAVRTISYHRDDGMVASAERSAAVTEGFPDTWTSHVRAAGLENADPLPRVAAVVSRPFLWSEVAGLVELSKDERAYMAGLRRLGLSEGLSIPVFGPNMRNAHLGLGFGMVAPTLEPQEIFELHCAAEIAHLKFCDLTTLNLVNGARLSPRELEILRWIARGKSNSVIAEILGISRHTVDTMMRRMFEKLEVHDRTTAAIRGLRTGLLRHTGSEVM